MTPAWAAASYRGLIPASNQSSVEIFERRSKCQSLSSLPELAFQVHLALVFEVATRWERCLPATETTPRVSTGMGFPLWFVLQHAAVFSCFLRGRWFTVSA